MTTTTTGTVPEYWVDPEPGERTGAWIDRMALRYAALRRASTARLAAIETDEHQIITERT